MTIDYNKYNYTPIDSFKNVVNEVRNDLNKAPASIHSALNPLISKLALRHPEWTFIGEHGDYHSNCYHVKRFRIYEGIEPLGSVHVSTWKDITFEIRNTRIAKSMARRGYKSTKDMDKALKIVESTFSAKDVQETFEEGREKAAGVMQSKVWNTDREFSRVWNDLTPAIVTYVALNLDKMRPTLEAYGASANSLDALIGRYEEAKKARTISQARQKGDGTTVVLFGDRYIVSHRGSYGPQLMTASQLSEGIRTKLGVLKLVENEQIVEGFGMRVNSTVFYLLP